jgi:peptidoglycan/xylan/chitin deacetylase (PgdA/CDA1 family)
MAGKSSISAGAFAIAGHPVLGSNPSFSSGTYWTQQIPQKLIASPAVYEETMDATTGWSIGGTGATFALNNTEFRTGTGSLKLTTGSGVTGYIEKTVNWDLSSDSGKSLELWLYLHTVLAGTVGYWNVNIQTKGSWTHYFGGGYNVNYLGKDNWTNTRGAEGLNIVWTPNGTPDWSQVTKIRLSVTPKTGQVAQISFDTLKWGEVKKRAILITFDDNEITQYTKAYPLMRARQMVGTTYQISDTIGTVGHLSVAQLIELNGQGWDVGNHAKTHTSLATLSEAQQETEIVTCKNVLNGLGLTRASMHVAYPNDAYNNDTIIAMTNLGMKTGRKATYAISTKTTGVFIWWQWSRYEIGYPYIICSASPSFNDALSVATGYIEAAFNNDAVPILFFHVLDDDSAPDNRTWLTSKFTQLLDYIVANKIQTLTIDEYDRLNSGAITVHHK